MVIKAEHTQGLTCSYCSENALRIPKGEINFETSQIDNSLHKVFK